MARSKSWTTAALLALLAACGGTGAEVEAGAVATERSPAEAEDAVSTLGRELSRVDAHATRIDSIFQPLPLLAPAAESELRRYLAAPQLERARALGIERGLSDAELAALETSGVLRRLEDGEYWIVRDLGYSSPLVVPGLIELLNEVGSRFQERLESLGAPPFRVEISSALRSASDQENLRAVNPNAAGGESTHEYGTSVDLLYSAFAAPLDREGAGAGELTGEAAAIVDRYADVALERVAARRALELKRVLGEVLIELQREGRVLVTLERQQPVFHITLGSP